MFRLHGIVRKDLHTANVYDERPWMDLNGLGYTVFFKSSGEGSIHIDWNDALPWYTFLIPLGDFEGADLQLPQLGLRIPVIPRQALAFQGRLLAHCHSPILSGVRKVIVIFTHQTLLDWHVRRYDD